ncbi:WD40 repeat-like protein [Ramaria rubella]|nr:WD40 repeat-like protein [Ramaria rubella]
MTSTVSVHRCRFVDYTPTAITAIALPPLPLPLAKLKRKQPASSSLDFGTLAVGRANGNVELHEWTGVDSQNPAPQAWVVQKVLPGPVPSKVDSLVFTLRPRTTAVSEKIQLKDLRLFSIGGGSEVLEWNLEGGGIIRSISSQAGSVWSMAANPASTLLALGCEDGSVRLLSLADDTLTHFRRFERVKARLLSIAWGPPVVRRPSRLKTVPDDNSSPDEDEEDGWVDTWLVTGCSDSSVRKFDFGSGRVLDRMTTDKARGERTLVWTIGVLGDGTIISGDSLGSVKFWDSSTCTQLQNFQTHSADVLCLTIGFGGRSVYTSGVDQKICQFSNVQVISNTAHASSAPSYKWVHTSSRRLHSHDVRALAVWPPYSPLSSSHWQQIPSGTTPVLVSGGLDMSLVICPCAPASLKNKDTVNLLASGSISTFEDAYYQCLPYTTGLSPAIQVAPEARLVLCRRNTALTVWKINKSASLGKLGLADLEVSDKDRSADWSKVVEMDLKVRTNLIASAIANDGSWIAASDLYETKLFRCFQDKSGMRPKRIKLPGGNDIDAMGATSLLFTSDSSKLIIGASMGNSLLVVVDLAGDDTNGPRVLRSFDHHRMQNVVVGGTRAVKNLRASVDVNGVDSNESPDETDTIIEDRPTLRSLDVLSATSTIRCMAASMDGQWLASADTRHRIHVFNMDSVQHHCAMPSFPNAITALSFDPSSPSTLVIGLANNTFQIFDVETRQFPAWSHALAQGPSPFGHLHDPLLGVTFDPDSAEAGVGKRVLLWGSSWMCKVTLAVSTGYGGFSKKRRRESRRLSTSDGIVAKRGVANGPTTQDRDDDTDFRLITRYRPLLLVDYLGPGELLVVERPLVDLLSTLPPAYFKPTYGS